MEPKSSAPPDFSVTAASVNRLTVITVTGELDMSTAPRLDEALVACDGQPVVVDLTALSFIDSSGLHVLLQNRPEGRPAALVVTPDSNVAHTFDIVGASKTVLLCSHLQAAIEASARQTPSG